MIILDTNVLSAIMQDRPDPAVAKWLDDQPRESIWSTAVNVYELRYGIEILAKGRKRQSLEAALERLVGEALDERILPFDADAAESAGRVAAIQRHAGQPVEVRDVQIAGIAVARNATHATRNTHHFQGIGLALVDPWSA